MPGLSRSELAELLEDPNLHEAARAADDLRTERFGRRVTFAAVEHFDPGSGAQYCPVCGETALPQAVRASWPHHTDLHLLVSPQASGEELLASWRQRPRSDLPQATAQLGVAGDLAAGGEALLTVLVDEGLTVVSDGVRPDLHPAFGETATRRWQVFWRDAAKVGLRGHTVVLYGPDHGLASVLDQIEAIAAVQRDTDVFASVAPVIHRSDRFGGVQDGVLTHGSLDLRVLAACRLGLPTVPHVRVLYNRSDLKLAHLSLVSGADDLEGHLAFEDRDLSADADAKDLSLREMPRWLSEVGFAAQLRDAQMQSIPAAARAQAEADEGN